MTNTLLLLCALAVATRVAAQRTVLIAGFYPFNEDGWEIQSGAQIAFDNVVGRRHTADIELPRIYASDIKFEMVNWDTKGEQKDALESTIAAQERGASCVVGPSFSGESVVTSLLSNVYELPVVSYSATSPRLSDKSTFPFFFRNVPSDSAQGRALADMVDFFGQSRCIVIHTDESYGLGITEVFRERARELNITVDATITVPEVWGDELSEDDIQVELGRLLQTATEIVFGDSDDRVVRNVGTFVYLDPSPAGLGRILRAAHTAGLTGVAKNGAGDDASLIWIASDGGSSLDLAEADLPDAVRTGVFGTNVVRPTSDLYRDTMLKYWNEIRESGETFSVFGENSTLPEAVNIFAPYAYDAMLIVFHAIESLLEQGNGNFTGADLSEALKSVEFTGVTGVNKFDENQDRAPVYDILNGQGDNWVRLGAYEQEVKIEGSDLVFADGTSNKPDFTYNEPLATGFIVLIVIVVLLVLALLAVLLYITLSRRAEANRIAAEKAANAPAATWTAEEEAAALAKVESTTGTELDAASTKLVSTLSGAGANRVRVLRPDDAPLFGVARGTRCAIDAELADAVTLVNDSGAAIGYTVTLPDAGEECSFTIEAKPGTGTLKKGESRDISMIFRLLFTTKLQRWLKVEFDGVAGAVFLPLRVEGEVSSRVDPMELELFGKPLGEGAFGIVYRGRYRGTQVAAKVPRKQGDMKQSHLDSFIKEIDLFEKLRNPYIVNFVGASRVPGKLCICTELLERGTVLGLIHRAKVSLVLKCKMMLDAANALAYLHENGVLYRDLKPDNLLVFSVSHTASVNCKLSDFGTSIVTDDPFVPKKHTGSVGTPVYMSPEMMSNQAYSSKVDCYSLSMSMWEILAEKAPFGHLKRIWDLPRLVLDGMRPEIDKEWNEKIAKVISDCWLHNPERRPTAKEAAASLQSVYDRLKSGYDKERASKKKTAGLQGEDEGSKARTAHTGQLNELIQMSEANPEMISTNEGKNMMERAADIDGTSGSEKKKKKPKKKKAKATSSN